MLIALSVRGAMGQYLEMLATELARRIELYLFVPRHYQPLQLTNGFISYFSTGNTKLGALLRLLDLAAALRLWEQIEAVKPHVVHIFNGEGYPWTLLWTWKSQQCGLPLLVTVHDPEPHPGNTWEWFNAHLRLYVLQGATSIHVHSARFAQVVKNQGAKDVQVIPHGSLAPRFLQYKKDNIRREPLALFFGRLEAYKGLDILVEAGILLKGKLRVAIAGPGDLPQRTLSKIRGNREIFELHNRFLDDPEVAQFLQRASVCLLPYRQASQSSIPLIAAAFGVPVVATAVGAFIEDVPRVGGKLVPPGDPEALAQAAIEAMGSVPVYPRELEFCYLVDRFIEWYKHYG